jgi:hypothetical protein
VGKFGTLFRRPGQRVIVDYHGDIVVRPSPHEIQLRNGAPPAAAVPGAAAREQWRAGAVPRRSLVAAPWTEAPHALGAASLSPYPHEPVSVLQKSSVTMRVKMERVHDAWSPVSSAAGTS